MEKDVRIVMENLVVKIEIEIKQKRQVKYRLKLENIYDKCPELMKEWNWEKNKQLNPQDITRGSNKEVWWICPKGHEWIASVYHRTNKKSSCPYCSGRYAISGENDLQTLYPDIGREWHPEKNNKLRPIDVKAGSNRRVWWICSAGHEWQAKICDRTRKKGSGCPYCSGNLNIEGVTDLKTLFPKIAKEYDCVKNANKLPEKIFAKSGKKVWWICDKGHSWQASVISRTNMDSGCPFCSGKRPVPGENDLETLRPDLAAEWHTQKNKTCKPSDCTISSGRKVWWICSFGHEWQSVINTRTGKEKCGCPYCSGRYAIPGETDLETLRPDLREEWHFEKNKKIKMNEVTLHSNKKVWWRCKNGHEWRTTVAIRSRGSNCPYCSK